MTNAYALRAGFGIDDELGDATWLSAYYQSTQAFRFENEAILFSERRPRDVDMGLQQQVVMGITTYAAFPRASRGHLSKPNAVRRGVNTGRARVPRSLPAALRPVGFHVGRLRAPGSRASRMT